MQYILLVEDDEDLAEGIALALEGEGLSFTRCRSAKEAREALEKQNYDLLLFDISLPDGSGLELCRKVRQTSRVPIALLTAKDMELDIVKGLEGGADDYITKPFSLMVLRARIRALLRRTAGGPEEVYQKSPFCFRFGTMEFFKNGQALELGRTEQRILHLLVFNPGQILTRERLLAWVWPEGTEYVEDNALSVGIRRLRERLEEDPSHPFYIRTVYGKGYIWEEKGDAS